MNATTPIDNRNSTPLVMTASQFETQDLLDLVAGKSLAIRIPGFYSPELCETFAASIMSHHNVESYKVAPDIKKIGKAIFDAASDPLALEEYYKTAQPALDALRKFFDPYLAPMDRLRLIIQERWAAGGLLECLHGRTMFCGLVRAFEEGAEARPHQDMTHWDVPDSEPAKTLITQIATNIYLSVADDGGQLELWPYGFSNEHEYERCKMSGDYGLDRTKIGPSLAMIEPQPGDLIMFDARKIHAVNRINKGTRVAVSTFIGYRGPNCPLTVYS